MYWLCDEGNPYPSPSIPTELFERRRNQNTAEIKQAGIPCDLRTLWSVLPDSVLQNVVQYVAEELADHHVDHRQLPRLYDDSSIDRLQFHRRYPSMSTSYGGTG